MKTGTSFASRSVKEPPRSCGSNWPRSLAVIIQAIMHNLWEKPMTMDLLKWERNVEIFSIIGSLVWT